MIRIAICEDESTSLAVLMAMLDEYCANHSDFQVEITPYNNPNDLMHVLRLGTRYDMFFLDIYMEDTDGISLAEFIRKLDTRAKLVFTTSSKEHALDAFRVGATQYLIKPISKTELNAVMDALTEEYLTGEPTFLLSTSKGKITAPVGEILFAEYYQHIITYHLSDDRTMTSKSLRIPFSEAVSNLLSDRGFIQPHKSFVVNLRHVAGYSPTKFLLDVNDLYVPISKSFRAAAKSAYSAFSSIVQSEPHQNA